MVVGDRVALAGDISGAPGTLARIVRVEPRTTVLRRSADDTDPVERVIVANADQLVIVTALADPPPRLRLIDRFLVAAYDAGLDAAALPDQGRPGRRRDELLAAYGPLGIPMWCIGRPLTQRSARRRLRKRADRPDQRAGRPLRASASPRWSTRWSRTRTGRWARSAR